MVHGLNSLDPSTPARRTRSGRWFRRGIAGLMASLLVPLALSVGAEPGSKPPPSSAKQKNPDFSVETKREQIRISPTKKLRVINHLGDVRARRGKGSDLNIISIVQRFKKDQTDAKTLINTEADQVEITTSYPSAVPDEGGERQGRIDLSLLVPYGAELTVETLDGLIEIKGVHRPIQARSESGRVRVSTGRRVKAHTDTGKLGITLGSPTQRESAELSTVTGAIQVDFAGYPMPSLRVQTKGQINAKDIPGTVALLEGSQDVSILESGEKPYNLRVQSETGNIFMRALDRPRNRGAQKPAAPKKEAAPEAPEPKPPAPS